MSARRGSLHLVLAMVLVVATVVMGGFYRAAAAPVAQAARYDFVLVLDRSGSINPAEFALEQAFAKSVAVSCVLGADARAGLVQFGSQGTASIVQPLTTNSNDVVSKIAGLEPGPESNLTDIQEGLQFARNELRNSGRQDAQRFIILLTDGQQFPQGTGDPVAEANAARGEGVQVFAVGVGNDQNPGQLAGIASDPDSSYLYSVNQFEQLRATIRQLIPNACGNVPIIDFFDEPTAQPAYVSVVQRPDPNMTSRRNGIVTYTIVAKNHGKGDANNTFITMPFNKNEVKVLDAKFSRPSAWVSELNDGHLEIRTGRLIGGADVVTATVRLQTLGSVAEGVSLGERLEYRWDDNIDDGTGRSNQTVLAVGAADNNATYYPLTAAPASAPAGTKVTFKGAAFAPNEPMTFWYNSPTKPGIGIGMERADQDGVATLVFNSADLTPGKYEMVAYGNWTGFTAVGSFEVTR